MMSWARQAGAPGSFDFNDPLHGASRYRAASPIAKEKADGEREAVMNRDGYAGQFQLA
jgi:hypothetical protein